ncbi:hypothetical protein AUJ65_02725 [Candidatus Micrarchaeota archaeon CG1_02_51_15]|nr:MAG: hypothetical protein AUJ65_02725 [Candidatus Micrarchaeota archaeon CG1_02_51_15]
MFEKLTKMKEKVKEELSHIPRGVPEQNEIRMYYWPLRLSSLKGGKEKKTKKQVLNECVAKVKKNNPAFTVQYDVGYFSE